MFLLFFISWASFFSMNLAMGLCPTCHFEELLYKWFLWLDSTLFIALPFIVEVIIIIIIVTMTTFLLLFLFSSLFFALSSLLPLCLSPLCLLRKGRGDCWCFRAICDAPAFQLHFCLPSKSLSSSSFCYSCLPSFPCLTADD